MALIPALLRSGAIESDGRCEAWIPRATKKNKPHISSKTKAILKQHINTTADEEELQWNSWGYAHQITEWNHSQLVHSHLNDSIQPHQQDEKL
jgi:hypothetical protein